MKSRVTKNDAAVLILTSLGLAAVASISWKLFGEAAVIVAIAVALAFILWMQLESMRRTSEQIDLLRKNAFDDYRQIESLLAIASAIRPDAPLPPLRDHSASPDFLRHVISHMGRTHPSLCVELGSGSSTIFIAYCLKQLGSGKLISLEHDVDFAEKTRLMIQEHGLTQYASVQWCPLQAFTLDNAEYRWYSLDQFTPPGAIDLVIIDGPPFHVHPLARYPALPLLWPFMATTTSLFLDDASRPEETRTVGMWKEKFPDFSWTQLEAEKGAMLISRSAPGPAYSLTGEFGKNKRAAHSGA
jgi:predicted O-methyltransferase YrrM